MITRRNLVLALGAGALAPLGSFAQQQGKVWRVGFPVQRHLLRSMVPKVSRVAVLVNPVNATTTAALKNIQAAAQKLGVKIQSVQASTPQEIAHGFAVMARKTANALGLKISNTMLVQAAKVIE